MSQYEKAPRVILAPNPSPMTGPGTNSFLIGHAEVAVIDPGPDVPAHLNAILRAAGDGRISHILITHAHLDHSAGARRLARMTGAPILGFGPPTAGRSSIMQRLAESSDIGGGEGMDAGFLPDIQLRDGEAISSPEWRITALHTPGHFAGHLSFAAGDEIFCGDIVLGWSSTLISPPDGDLSDYMRSLSRLTELAPRRLLPAHGGPIEHPFPRLSELADHRRHRTAQILTALQSGPASADSLAQEIYDVDPRLARAASRNVLAHLIALYELGAVVTRSDISINSVFRLA